VLDVFVPAGTYLVTAAVNLTWSPSSNDGAGVATCEIDTSDTQDVVSSAEQTLDIDNTAGNVPLTAVVTLQNAGVIDVACNDNSGAGNTIGGGGQLTAAAAGAVN
jgi:hypothetical protein